MARVSENTFSEDYQEGITLDRYQELMKLPIAAFNGLNNPDEINNYECTTIWSQTQRDYLATYLAAAEEMREQELGFFIAPKYLALEEHPPFSPIVLDRKHLIKIGKQTDDFISTETITLTTGIITITVATSVIDKTEILVTYPNEMIAIHPSSVVISSGNAVISIPRSRLVLPSLNVDVEDPLDYFDDTNFLASVDIYRRWYDPSLGIEIVSSLANSFTDSINYGYGIITNKRTSIVDVHAALWTAGVPVPQCLPLTSCGIHRKFIRINYLSGRQSSVKVELETARLAHTLMPYSPCNCDAVTQYWQADVDTKDFDLTPYGNKSGSLNAWISDSRAKVGFGTTVGGRS